MTVVADVHKSMQTFRDAVPKDVKVNFEFDESPTVVAAVESVATEGLIGAGLTGLMILLFLGDLRSVIVVVSNIPLALLGSLFGLWITGNTINIMSLGGMALAIGILVDEATVTIENVHVQMGHTPNLATAVLLASNATAVPRLLALAVHSVGVHTGVHHGRPTAVPLHAADPGSRLCHDLVVPALQHVRADLVREPAQAHGGPWAKAKQAGLFDRMLKVYGKVVSWFVHLRWFVMPAYLGACALVLWRSGHAGRHRAVPPGRLGAIRAAVPAAARLELRADAADGPRNASRRSNTRRSPKTSRSRWATWARLPPTSASTTWCCSCAGPTMASCGSPSARTSGIKLAEFRERLRKLLPERVIPWLAERLVQGGLSKSEAQKQAKMSTFGFEPGDIVTKVMSFGSLTPIAVRVVGTDLKDGPVACGKDRRRHEAHPLPSRCPVRADARLP